MKGPWNIANPLTDDGRNKINEMFQELYNEYREAGLNAKEAREKAHDAVMKSDEAMALSERTQKELSQAILEGDSSPLGGQLSVGADGTIYSNPQERLVKEFNSVNQKLAQTENEIDDYKEMKKYERNAVIPLHIPTYDGSDETTHPDVLYIPEGWNGKKYWMAHTPYPNSDDDFENPSIVSSVDGRIWKAPHGLKNPIDIPTQEELDEGYHMSDPELVMVNRTLECWYRFNVNGGTEQLMRKTSTDGVNWSDREIVFDLTNSGMLALSPSIIYEDGLYKMWFVDNETIYYTESETGELGSWSTFQEVNLNYRDNQKTYWKPWHIDVERIDNQYVIVISTHKSSGGHRDGDRDTVRDLLIGESSDGLTFNNVRLLLEPSISGWDNWELYRASIIKTGKIYKLYYSARSTQDSWGIGLIQGDSLDSMTNPGIPVDDKGRLSLPTIALSDLAHIDRYKLVFGVLGEMGVRLRITNNNELTLESDSGLNIARFVTRFLQTTELDVQESRQLRSYLDAVYAKDDVDEISMHDQVTVRRTREKPKLKLLNAGVNDAMLTLGDENHTMRVSRTSDTETAAFLEVAGLFFQPTTDVHAYEGAIRYNPEVKKHQGFNGEGWHDLY